MQKVSKWFTFACLLFSSCTEQDSPSVAGEPLPESVPRDSASAQDMITEELPPPKTYYQVARDVHTRDYFSYMDSLAQELDSTYDYELSEYILVHANRRILDTLMAQDYYYRKAQGIVVEDPNALLVLQRGDSLEIPSRALSDSIQNMLNRIYIDVNIPEYTLRIMQGDSILHRCLVRIGKNKRAYLAMAGREIDLRTPIGEGEIIRVEKDPWYINPVDNKRYKKTQRDDGQYTQLPRIPFLEPMIAGLRQGALLHPTTNLSTLGKAISNGCVGMRESDAWMLYYHAPLGTKVVFRYDLEGIRENGDTLRLKDVYQLKRNKP
jgi:L,D-transpeptidase ErfK/SrfK